MQNESLRRTKRLSDLKMLALENSNGTTIPPEDPPTPPKTPLPQLPSPPQSSRSEGDVLDVVTLHEKLQLWKEYQDAFEKCKGLEELDHDASVKSSLRKEVASEDGSNGIRWGRSKRECGGRGL